MKALTAIKYFLLSHFFYRVFHIYLSKFSLSETIDPFKGRGMYSSQSEYVGNIQLSMQLSNLSIIFENLWF